MPPHSPGREKTCETVSMNDKKKHYVYKQYRQLKNILASQSIFIMRKVKASYSFVKTTNCISI